MFRLKPHPRQTVAAVVKVCRLWLGRSGVEKCRVDHKIGSKTFISAKVSVKEHFVSATSYSVRARNEVRGTIMCASVFPFSHKNIEGVFVGTVVPLLCRNMS